MTIGLVGRKCGMTRVFTEDGIAHPVTVIQIHEDHKITQLKTLEKDFSFNGANFIFLILLVMNSFALPYPQSDFLTENLSSSILINSIPNRFQINTLKTLYRK